MTHSRVPSNSKKLYNSSSLGSIVVTMFYLAFVLCLFGNALAQVPSLGACPKVETVPNFDVSKYLGRWYEAKRYFAVFEFGGKCVTADYSEGENNTVKVVNTETSRFTGQVSSIEGVARTPNPDEPAKLKVSFSSVPFGIEGNYWILGTDYESFATVYSCTDAYLLNFKFVWILTRKRNPSQAVIDKAVGVLEKQHIDTSPLLNIDQINCSTETPKQ